MSQDSEVIKYFGNYKVICHSRVGSDRQSKTTQRYLILNPCHTHTHRCAVPSHTHTAIPNTAIDYQQIDKEITIDKPTCVSEGV